jgi:hypothetical protein
VTGSLNHEIGISVENASGTETDGVDMTLLISALFTLTTLVAKDSCELCILEANGDVEAEVIEVLEADIVIVVIVVEVSTRNEVGAEGIGTVVAMSSGGDATKNDSGSHTWLSRIGLSRNKSAFGVAPVIFKVEIDAHRSSLSAIAHCLSLLSSEPLEKGLVNYHVIDITPLAVVLGIVILAKGIPSHG